MRGNEKAGTSGPGSFPPCRSDTRQAAPRFAARVPGPYDDWWVCMFSTRLHQEVQSFDEVIDAGASDFEQSGLKTLSVIRVARLAVVSDEMLLGCIGAISEERLDRIREKLTAWIQGSAG